MNVDNDSLSLPLPWHEAEWRHLTSVVNTNRLPHALLFHGNSSLEIFSFARHFIRSLFCEEAKKPCHSCKNCRLISNDTHSDFHCVVVEENASSIKVEQIRQLNYFLSQTAEGKNYRVVLINEAEKMNRAAANALLKNLEEPPAKNALIILVSSALEFLLPTIRSRCQSIKFSTPDFDMAKHWLSSRMTASYDLDYLLQVARHSPLQILEWQKENKLDLIAEFPNDLKKLYLGQVSPIEMASKYQKEESVFIINLLICWHMAMLKTAVSTDNQQGHFFRCIDKLYEYKKMLASAIQLNKQLLLETLFTQINSSH